MTEQCPKHVPVADAPSNALYVRTNERTNGEHCSPSSDNSPFVTRTRTYGFSRFGRADQEADAAANHHNAKCDRYFTRRENGLEQSWAGERVWCNPPYSDLEPWVRKAFHAMDREGAELVVMLVPANRTEQRFWQDLIEPVRDRPDGRLRVEFIRGRLRFLSPGEEQIPRNSRPPFGLLIWGDPR